MIERSWKICMAVGFSAGLCAVVLSLLGGCHFQWDTGVTGANINIQIGAAEGDTAMALGTIAILTLVLGGAFFAVHKEAMRQVATSKGTVSEDFLFLSFLQNLHKSKKDCWIGGVCGGIGEHSPIPSWIWRMVFLVLAFCFGVGLFPYIVLWICMPAVKITAGNDNLPDQPDR